MAQDHCSLTVYFEDPFWVGLYEREEKDGYQVSKITFGAEPRDYEVYEWLLTRWGTLRFSSFLPSNAPKKNQQNRKRVKREAGKWLSGPPVGTKAQEALKLQRAELKISYQEGKRNRKREEEAKKYRLHPEKKRKKHKGR